MSFKPQVLGIMLTQRAKTGDLAVPMCGIPHRSLESYLKRLISSGYRVAVCDQVEPVEEARRRGGIVKREVVRLVTPGTLTEDSFLSPGAANYLVALSPGGGDSLGLAWVDISTGEFGVATSSEGDLRRCNS